LQIPQHNFPGMQTNNQRPRQSQKSAAEGAGETSHQWMWPEHSTSHGAALTLTHENA